MKPGPRRSAARAQPLVKGPQTRDQSHPDANRPGRRPDAPRPGFVTLAAIEQAARQTHLHADVVRCQGHGLLPGRQRAFVVALRGRGFGHQLSALRIIRIQAAGGFRRTLRLAPQPTAGVGAGQRQMHGRVIRIVVQRLLQCGNCDLRPLQIQTHLPEPQRPIRAGGCQVQRPLIALQRALGIARHLLGLGQKAVGLGHLRRTVNGAP